MRLIGLREAVAGVRDTEGAITVRHHLEKVRPAVVNGRRRQLLARSGIGERTDRHGVARLVEFIRDEHAWYGVLLPAELRRMHLPDVFEPRRTEQHLHRRRLGS